MMSDFYKKNESDKVWWIKDFEHTGRHLFSFDRKKIYNFFLDYPQSLSPEEKALFDKENPFWKQFYEKGHKKPERPVENSASFNQ